MAENQEIEDANGRNLSKSNEPVMESDIDILLIEDNHDEAQLVIRTLRKNNLSNHLLHLDDGEEALNFLFSRGKYSHRTTFRKPFLVLLDLKLPKVDGMEILRQLKDDESTRPIPVVMLTSSREEKDILACYHLGVNSYVVKPVSFETLSDAVKSLGNYWLNINQRPLEVVKQ
jgi:two-component system response regulator